MNKLIFLIILSFANVVIANTGKDLFLKHCSACHGFTGNGGVGVPLNLKSFINSVDDSYLKNTIIYGRPGRVMEGFDYLGDDKINKIVKFMGSWRDKPAPVFSNKNITGDYKNGKELYKLKCQKCHGENGEGAKGTGVSFSRTREQPILAPALNNIGFLKSATDEMIKKTLMEGRTGTDMKSYIKQGFREDSINDIVFYIRSFEKKSFTKKKQDMTDVITAKSQSNFTETVQMVEDAIVGANFVHIRTTTFEKGFSKNPNKKQAVIHFCNFKLLYDALAIDPRVGLFLPCTITITEEDKKVFIYAGNPQKLSLYFNNTELEDLCNRMSNMYSQILDDSSL
jgi:cytochrome c oxidase cbb3-type subunit III